MFQSDGKQNLEEAFKNLFSGGTTGTGEEELLKVASRYSMQLSSQQMKCLLYIEHEADRYELADDGKTCLMLRSFVSRWIKWKEYNNSAGYVMRIIDNISLRRFLTENSFKVDIQK